MMRKSKYNIGDKTNCLEIVGILKSRRSPCGVLKRYFKVKCLLCGSTKNFSTQTIDNAKSCGCLKYANRVKSPLSGRRAAIGTKTSINNLLSIYKSNAKKRNICFELDYKEFKKLITGKCFYCGDSMENTLRKRGYIDFKYTGIDRVNNNKGYANGNVISCCSWCNQAKNKHPVEYFISKCKKISNIEKDDKYFEIAKNRIKDTQCGKE